MAITIVLAVTDPEMSGGVFSVAEIADRINTLPLASLGDYFVEKNYLGHAFTAFKSYLSKIGWKVARREQGSDHGLLSIGQFWATSGFSIFETPPIHDNHGIKIEDIKNQKTSVIAFIIQVNICKAKNKLLSTLKPIVVDQSTKFSEFCTMQNVMNSLLATGDLRYSKGVEAGKSEITNDLNYINIEDCNTQVESLGASLKTKYESYTKYVTLGLEETTENLKNSFISDAKDAPLFLRIIFNLLISGRDRNKILNFVRNKDSNLLENMISGQLIPQAEDILNNFEDKQKNDRIASKFRVKQHIADLILQIVLQVKLQSQTVLPWILAITNILKHGGTQRTCIDITTKLGLNLSSTLYTSQLKLKSLEMYHNDRMLKISED